MGESRRDGTLPSLPALRFNAEDRLLLATESIQQPVRRAVTHLFTRGAWPFRIRTERGHFDTAE